MPINKGTDKEDVDYTHNSAIKRNETGPFVEARVNLESVTQSEVSQREKTPYMWTLEKW